jgi:hypothetical protein
MSLGTSAFPVIGLLATSAAERVGEWSVGAAGPSMDETGGDRHPETSLFEAEHPVFGAGAIDLRIGGISLRVAGLSARQQADLAARYGIFARPLGGEVGRELEIEVRRSPVDGYLKVRRQVPAELYRLLMRREGGNLLAWSYEWAGLCRFEERKATLLAASEERIVFDRCVENFLRVVFAHLALEKGGILLHGAAVVRDGRAYVFFGPSGSGKTTVTTLSAGSRILSDDLILIVPEGKGFAASSVPFRGLLAPPATEDRTYPLAGLFRLVKDSEVYLEDVSRPRAVGEVVQSLPFVTDRPEAAPRILEVVSDLAGLVAVKRLHFRKDASFWGIVESQ